MTVTIAELTEREFFAWYALFTEYAAGERVAPTDEQVMRVWTTLQEPEALAFVARDGSGEVVGLVHVTPFERLLQGDGGYAVEDLYVAAGSRRSGVATALLEQVRSRAESDGRPTLRWQSHGGDAAETALQERFAATAGAQVLQTLPVG